MNNMQNNINWKYVCIYQILSELFIAKFQDKVDWKRYVNIRFYDTKTGSL